MPDFILPKSANEWGSNELDYFKIDLVEMTLDEFFQNSVLPAIPPDFYDYVNTELDDLERVEDNTLYARLHEMRNADDPAYSETAVDIFALRFLEMIQFTNRPALVKMNMPLTLHFGSKSCSGNPNLVAMDNRHFVSGFYQENKTARSTIRDKDVFAQLIAEGIAAFQHNDKLTNSKRNLLMRFPAITMRGTSPIFHMVNVTASLAGAVRNGDKPSHTTRMYHCYPDPKNLGMQSIENRKRLVSYLLAFKYLKERTV
jgi:hypothetical protein